jgi:3-methyladenine DNA glycosylase AlkD
MSILAAKIREDLRMSADPKAKEGMQRFFKEPLNCYGMRTADMAKIMKRHLGEALALGKEESSPSARSYSPRDSTRRAS